MLECFLDTKNPQGTWILTFYSQIYKFLLKKVGIFVKDQSFSNENHILEQKNFASIFFGINENGIHSQIASLSLKIQKFA